MILSYSLEDRPEHPGIGIFYTMTSPKNIGSIEEIKMRQAYLEIVLDSAPDAIVGRREQYYRLEQKGRKVVWVYLSRGGGENVDDLLACGDPALNKEAVSLSDQIATKSSPPSYSFGTVPAPPAQR